MSLVPIPIGDLTLHFRKLTFMKEFAVVYPEGLDPRRIYLVHALDRVTSGD